MSDQLREALERQIKFLGEIGVRNAFNAAGIGPVRDQAVEQARAALAAAPVAEGQDGHDVALAAKQAVLATQRYSGESDEAYAVRVAIAARARWFAAPAPAAEGAIGRSEPVSLPSYKLPAQAESGSGSAGARPSGSGRLDVERLARALQRTYSVPSWANYDPRHFEAQARKIAAAYAADKGQR